MMFGDRRSTSYDMASLFHGSDLQTPLARDRHSRSQLFIFEGRLAELLRI